MMILPILSYAGPIKLTYTQTQKDRLISLLNRAKNITGLNDTHGDVHDVIQRHNCILVRKCLQQQTNSVTLNNYFEILSHTMETRGDNYLLRLPQVKLETARQGFYYGGAKLYNSLPLTLRMDTHLNKFKILLTDFKFLDFNIM